MKLPAQGDRCQFVTQRRGERKERTDPVELSNVNQNSDVVLKETCITDQSPHNAKYDNYRLTSDVEERSCHTILGLSKLPSNLIPKTLVSSLSSYSESPGRTVGEHDWNAPTWGSTPSSFRTQGWSR
jgi:hypothetical protein